ncbi:hypothetical protein C2W62_36080 [Candidatus Entotheonella serta]|nr:hypothetical protein C2W62_36080 [Candidatus Entotheonella serta]
MLLRNNSFIAVLEDMIHQDILAFTSQTWQIRGGLKAIERVVPENLRRLITQQMDQLSQADQAWLEAASVEGRIFTVAAVAARIGMSGDELEPQVIRFARAGRFVQVFGTDYWPDGTMTASYRFLHAMYREVIYQRMSEGQRMQWHEQIGQCKEEAYGAQAASIAGELSVHFDRAQNVTRAIRYRQHAVEQAIQRSAYVQAHEHLNRGLELLPQLADSAMRQQYEYILQAAQGRLLMATKGYTAPESVARLLASEGVGSTCWRHAGTSPHFMGNCHILSRPRRLSLSERTRGIHSLHGPAPTRYRRDLGHVSHSWCLLILSG